MFFFSGFQDKTVGINNQTNKDVSKDVSCRFSQTSHLSRAPDNLTTHKSNATPSDRLGFHRRSAEVHYLYGTAPEVGGQWRTVREKEVINHRRRFCCERSNRKTGLEEEEIRETSREELLTEMFGFNLKLNGVIAARLNMKTSLNYRRYLEK